MPATTTTATRSTTLDPALISHLATAFRGDLFQPGDPGYDAARMVYNAMIDKRPALIARCADVADVIAAVNFARDNHLLLAVRGGGHNGPGLGTCDGGLVIDLSQLHGVRVAPDARTVRVGGGATWAQVDHATHAFGLATPSGFISTTGVGGLTLGGGIGYLTRAYGLTIDNLLEVDVVLADGRLVTANEQEHPDLFWAVRGGGGNFGVITSFLFRLHPVDTVVAGPTLWPLDRAKEILSWYRDFLPAAPTDLNGWFAFLKVPPAPPFPESLHLQTVCGVVWCYTGPADQADARFAPVRATKPVLNGVQAMPFPVLQSAFDALLPPGLRWYWTADFFAELPDEAIARHAAHGSNLPTLLSTMHLYPIDGAVSRVPQDATAFAFRDARWAEVIAGIGAEPVDDRKTIDWARGYWNDLHPYSAGGAYVNMMMEEGQERIKAAYRGNYDRLAASKAKYDPSNLFRVNQNITPRA